MKHILHPLGAVLRIRVRLSHPLAVPPLSLSSASDSGAHMHAPSLSCVRSVSTLYAVGPPVMQDFSHSHGCHCHFHRFVSIPEQ